VPLTNGHVLVGVLTLYAARPKAFDDDRGRLIQMIAPHVAQTLARSRRQAAEATDSRANLRLVSTR
jgi:GAF domain-containing protein